MKILILTHPLHTNYGGLLQAFALQKFLRELGGGGNDVATIDWFKRHPLWRRAAVFLLLFAWRFYQKFILRKKGIRVFPKPRKPKPDGREMRRFVDENIRVTPRVNILEFPRALAQLGENPDAFVVGSDQVWRRDYIPDLPKFFLGFLDGNDTHTRRIAYSASFGIDFWDYTQKQTHKCAVLAQKFHAISVREDSGVALCAEHLGVPAEHLVDPTLLLSREEYCEIVARDEARSLLEKRGNAPRVFSYILDESPEKRAIANAVARELGGGGNDDAAADELMPKSADLRAGEGAFPPVSAWLRGFRDAEFVVTDSFHGSVFSIIFNKPFIAIGNASRGMARFNSLLKMFGLENRLILPTAGTPEIAALVSAPIDWQSVNARRSREIARSREFLTRALGGNA